MAQRLFWQPDVECMPLLKLAELQNKKLNESGTIKRAYGLALYKNRWTKAGVKPADIQTRDDLKKLPFTNSDDLKKAFLDNSIERFACTENIRFWFSTSGTTGMPKWIPYSDEDIKAFQETALRAYFAYGARAGDKLLIITTPAPFVSDGLAYFNMIAEVAHSLHVELIPLSISSAQEGLEFCMRLKPEYIIGFPSVLMKVSEVLEEEVPKRAKEQYEKEKNFKNFAALLATKIIKIKPKHLFGSKKGAFGGEPLDPYREALKDAYGIDTLDLYAFTEFPSVCPECTMHAGTHIWIDYSIVELIPDEELKKEATDPKYVPNTIFLDEAKPGMIGEYVITTFSTALPLIRYRTSDLMRVVSTDKCACGRTHPRVTILQRQDDIVNMGLIRFSTYDLDAKLKGVSQAGKVKGWQMHIKREGYKPKPLILVQPEGAVKEEDFIKEVRKKMFEIDVFKTGCEQGLVLDPEIKVVNAIDEKRTHTGKLRYVLYEGVD